MPPEDVVTCKSCGDPIKPDEPCYQLRSGALKEVLEDDGVTFLPEEDVGYYHQSCLVGEPNA